jgi:hypothetical protein
MEKNRSQDSFPLCAEKIAITKPTWKFPTPLFCLTNDYRLPRARGIKFPASSFLSKMNSVNYFKVMAKEKNWKCRPWSVINVDPKGNLVLPCYVRNEYATSVSVLETDIKTAVSGFNWKEIQNCEECSLHCYVEPSLVLSWDFWTYLNWAFRVRM